MKNWAVLALVGGVALSQAQYPSFNLVYVLDEGDKQIKRFDGDTGTYLGSIGQGWLQNPKGFALDRTNRLLWVADDIPQDNAGLVRAFDMFTGVMRNAVGTVFDPTAIGVQGTVLGTIGRTTFGTGLFTHTSTLQPTNSNLVQVGGVGLDVFTRSAGSASDFLLTEPGGIRTLRVSGGSVSDLGLNTNYLNGRGIEEFYSTTSTATGSNELFPNGTIARMSRVEDVAMGHVTAYAVGRGLQNEPLLVGIDRRLNLSQPLGQGQLIDPTRVEVFAAPEPGTMAAVGLGLAILIRRRKK